MRPADLWAAAALAGPEDPDPIPALEGAPDPDAVIEILRVNKVPLVELDPSARRATPSLASILSSNAWSEAVAREREERDALAAEFAAVSERFTAGGFGHVLFKSPGGLPYRSSNVDLLVAPDVMAKAARELSAMGHLRFPHYREDHKLLYRRFRAGRSAICVHLHEAVSWGKVMILEGDDVIARSRPGLSGSGIRVASAEDLVVITIAHALYETDQVRLSDLRAIRLAVSDPSFDPAKVVERVSRRGWLSGFRSMLVIIRAMEVALYGKSRLLRGLTGDEPARSSSFAGRTAAALSAEPPERLPYALPRRFTKGHYLRYLVTNRYRSGDERIADLFATVFNLSANRLRLRCRPPVVISLSGLDGSGKSSALRATQEAMTLCEIPVGVVWSRGGFSSWMQTAKKVARTAMPATIPGPSQTEAKRRWLERPVAARLFVIAVVIEQTFHYLLRVRLPRLAGWSMLCDRYAWDTQADLEAKLGSAAGPAGWAGSLMAAAAPRPDLAILLRVEPVTAARRKPEDAPAAHLLPAQAAALDRLAERHRLVVIDADRPGDDVIDDVVQCALRAAFARFGGGRE